MLAIDGGARVREAPMPERAPFGEEEKQAVMRFCDEVITQGKRFGYGGEDSKAYEGEFARYMGGGFAHCVSSGTAAIHVALAALELDPGDEVVVPPITDQGGVMPVALQCLVPVPADTWPGSYNTGAEQIEAALTERSRAVIVAHIGGEPCDMDPIVELVRRRDLHLIEDVAQAHGALYKGRLVGTFGHLAAFSTMWSKIHTTGAQGGLVFTSDEDLHWKTVRFADRGKPHNLDAATNVAAALNFNQTDLAAAIGRVQLAKLDEKLAARRAVARVVRAGLEGARAVSTGPLAPDSESSYWFLRIMLDVDKLRVTKQRFVEALIAEGIPASASYRHLPSESEWFRRQRVFGASGYPWRCPDYKGPRHPEYHLPNAIATTDCGFNVALNDRYGPREAQDIVAALLKVEEAYLK